MVLEIEPGPDAITLDSDPYVIIRPEGDWDRPRRSRHFVGAPGDISAARGSIGRTMITNRKMMASLHDDPPILICADLQIEYLTEGRRHVIADADAITSRCLELLTLWRKQPLAGHASETDRAGRMVQSGLEPDGLDRGTETAARGARLRTSAAVGI